jgi:hypothetical protein
VSYDSKYKHGLSWLNNDEDEKCSGKIKVAMYAAIYDENPDPKVVEYLMRAYDVQRDLDDDLVSDGTHEPVCFTGEEAFKYLRAQYMKHALPLMKREGFARTEDDLAEVFEWPSSLPYDYPIRRAVLTSVAKRLAAADTHLYKSLRAYAETRDKVSNIAP